MKYLVAIMAGAIIVLVILQMKGCKDSTDQDKKAVITQQKVDSITRNEQQLKDSNDFKSAKILSDSVRFKFVYDSLNMRLAGVNGSLSDWKNKVKVVTQDLATAIENGTDTNAKKLVEDLQANLVEVNSQLNKKDTLTGQIDSLQNAEIDSLYAAIHDKDRTILRQLTNYTMLLDIRDKEKKANLPKDQFFGGFNVGSAGNMATGGVFVEMISKKNNAYLLHVDYTTKNTFLYQVGVGWKF